MSDDPDFSDYGLPRRWITILLIVLMLIFACLLFMPSVPDKGHFAFCLLGTAVLLVFWPVIAKIDNLKIGPTGVELRRTVEEAKEKANDAIEVIKKFVFNSMPQPVFQNLEKIASGRFGKFSMNEGFRQQLRSLRDSGYISTNNVFIGQIPNSGGELSDFVYVTPLGREFIDQRAAADITARQRALLKP